MFDKLFNKKKKEQDIFCIPQKKFSTDQKTISKLGSRALQEIVVQQDKYISNLISKISQAKKQYERIHDKVEQLLQKNQVINGEISRMTNEHQQLSIKFDNLQSSLELTISDNQKTLANELAFFTNTQQVQEHEIPKTLNMVLKKYQDKYILCNKIEKQNKFLKEKINDIELKFEQISEKYSQAEREKGYSNLIPELMQGLEELKKQKLNSNSQDSRPPPIVIIKKQMQTMVSQQDLEISAQQCLECARHLQSIKEKCKQISNLEKQIQNDNINNKSRIEQIKQQNEQLKDKLKELQQQQMKLISDRASTQIEENENILQKNKQLKKTIQQLQTENKDLQNKLTKLQKSEINNDSDIENQKSQNLINGQKLQLLQQQQKQQQFIKRIQELESKINQCKSVLCVQKQKKEELESKLVQKQELFKKTCIEHEEYIKSVQNQSKLQPVTQVESQLHQQLLSLSKEITAKQDQILLIKDQVAKQKKLNSELTRKLQNHYKSSAQIEQKCGQYQQKLIELQKQNDSLKKQYKRILEEKQIIQQSNEASLTDLNNNYQRIMNQKKQCQQKYQASQKKLNQLQKWKAQQQQEGDTFTTTVNKLNKQMTEKMMEVQRVNDKIAEKQSELKKKQKQIDQIFEQSKSKLRKLQSDLNQERIKTEAMKRTLTNQQTKLEQNEKSLNSFYEESLHKDKKITYMEIKLKQYKHLIQSLKKQKDQIEKAFEKKLKSFEETIPQISQDSSVDNEKKLDSLEDQEKENAQNILLDQITSYESNYAVLKQENQTLRKQMKQLQDQLDTKTIQVKSLQEKRQQSLKQIQKLNLRSINRTPADSGSFIQKEKQFLKEKEQWSQAKQKLQQKIIKVATKAYKGLDILLKHYQNIYKNFIIIFAKQLQRQQVKNFQSEVNILIKKCTDIKDVFQDYM